MQLTMIEQSALSRYEGVIERGLQTFVEVGNALLAIRDEGLYKEFGTFDDYCRQRWGLSKTHANRLIQATGVVNDLTPFGVMLPETESQARALVGLQPETAATILEIAKETAPDGKLTARHIEEIKQAAWDVEVVRGEPLTPQAVTEAYESRRNLKPLMTSDSDDWHTPRHILDRVMWVLKGIDLDPCSNLGTPNVPAARHYTIEDDGLAQEWRASTVYLNPPYGDVIGDWVRKLADEYEAGNISEAIALVPARTDTAWMRRLANYPRCFVWGRLKFSGSDNSAPFPSVVVYLGGNLPAFVTAFSDIGDVYRRLNPDGTHL